MTHLHEKTKNTGQRLAEIRAKLLMFSSETDTSTWEATFFLNLIKEKDREIRRLQRACLPAGRACRSRNA